MLDEMDATMLGARSINLGDKFASYEEVQVAIQNYCKINFISLWKRDARTIEKSNVTRIINQKLIYYELKYTCIHGGRDFVSCSKGLREVSTYRKECPSFIRLRASRDGESLEVVAVNHNHNHHISQEHYAHYPTERRLPDDIKSMAQELLTLKANKKLLKDKLMEKTGKIVLLKDLSNLRSANNDQKNNLAHCIKVIQEEYDCEVSVLKDEDSNFQCMLAQTTYMKNIFNLYPEFLAVDATYKLLNIGIPVYLLLVEDGHCQSQIVAMCLMVSESKDNIRWFLSTFKTANPICQQTRCIITDKDLTERDVIRELFPDVSLILCIFHTMRTFRRELKCEKMGMTESQKNCCLELLKQLIYAKTEADFLRNLETLKEVSPKTVLDYYFKNWHEIRHQWSMCTEFCKYNFLNNTNNRLESINGKLKDVISRNSSLEDFLHGFFKTISSMNSEREHKVIYCELKRPVTQFSKGSVEAKYLELLTKEPARQVIKQLEYSSNINSIAPDPDNNNLFEIKSSEGILKTDIYNCTCSYHLSMLLPCRHIFAVRKLQNEPLFDPSLPSKRWTVNYNKAMTFFSHNDSNNNEKQTIVTVTTAKPRNVVSYSQKRKEMLSLTNNLADLAAQRSNMLFERRKQLLLKLKTYWENDVDVNILPVNENENENSTVNTLNKNYHLDNCDVDDYYHVDDHDYCHVDNLEPSSKASKIVDLENISLDTSVNHESGHTTRQDLESIKMPQKIKKRGRVKGECLTTIGLPKKRKGNGPTSFIKLPVEEKQIFILKHIMANPENSQTVVNCHMKLTKGDIIAPESLPSKITDKNINVGLIKQFLSDEAFALLGHSIEEKKRMDFICSRCGKELAANDFVSCQRCLDRSHIKCLGKKTKSKNWFCSECLLK